MFVVTPKRKSGITVVRLVHGYRQNGKVKKKIIKTIGQSRVPEEIEFMKQSALMLREEIESGKNTKYTSPKPVGVYLHNLIGERVIKDGILDVFGDIYNRLGFDEIISTDRKEREWNEALKYCVLARFLDPSSKLRAIKIILDKFEKKFSHDQFLRMMDFLSSQEEKIKKYLSQKMIDKSKAMNLMLFDVTTLYFENINDTDLKKFGFSKDGKFKEVQVILALLTDTDGLPITYEVFPGNTAETKTFIPCLEKLKERHKIENIRITADKAMFSDKNFSYFEDKKKHNGREMQYIVSCPLKRLSKDIKQKILDKNNYRAINKDVSIYEFYHDGRRIVVRFSWKRASHDKYKRDEILEAAKKLEDKEGNIATEKLTRNRGISRYLEKSNKCVKIKKSTVLADEKWDGIVGLCTNIKTLSPEELLSSYKRLWKIEESFRISKHTLKMRPIYHRLSKRIISHIMICFLSYAVLRYTEILLKSKGLCYGSKELLDILSEIEKWVVRESKSKKTYLIAKKNSEEGVKIYKALGMGRNEAPHLLLDASEL